MVKLPDYTALGERDPRAAGIMPNIPGSDPRAAALQGLGGTLQDMGSEFLQQQQQRRNEDIAMQGTAADGGATRALSDFERTFDQDGDYARFSSKFDSGVAKIEDGYAKLINDKEAQARWRLEFRKQTLGARNRVLDLSAKRVREQQLVNAKSGLEGYQKIIADDQVTEEQRSKARRDAEGAITALRISGALSPDEADQWRKDIVEGGDFLLGERIIARNPGVLAGRKRGQIADMIRTKAQAAGVDPAVAVGIAQIESGLNPNARNPNSSAGGLFQQIDDTWNAWGGGASKFDPEANAENGVRGIRKTIDAFRKEFGRDPTAGEIYLGHFGGYGVLQKAARASDDTPVEKVFSPQAIRANPNLQSGKTMADVRTWADAKMAQAGVDSAKSTGPTGELPSWYSSQPSDKQLQLEQLAEKRRDELETEADAQRKVVQTTAKDDFSLRIATGDPRLTQQEILDSPILDNGDKATLIKSFNEARDQDSSASALLSSLAAGESVSLNPFDGTDRTTGDKAYATLDKAAPDEAKQSVGEAFVSSTGYIPRQIVADVRQDINSQSVPDIARGLERAARLYQIAPSAMEAIDNGKDLKDAALTFGSMVYDRGLSTEQAAKRWAEMHSPEAMAKAERLKAPAQAFLKTLSVSDVTGALDQSWIPFRGTPSPGLTADQQLAVMSDYSRIAEEKFLETGGDAALAKKMALNEIAGPKGLYGVSSVSGEAVVTKYPVEHFLPAVNGSWDYVREAAQIDVAAYLGDKLSGVSEIPAPGGLGTLQVRTAQRRIMLASTKETADDIRAGRSPRYRLYFQDDNGAWDEVAGALFHVNPDEIRLRVGEERRRSLAEAQDIHSDRVTGIERDKAAETAARRAYDATVGPDWMKAQAASDARQRALMGAD